MLRTAQAKARQLPGALPMRSQQDSSSTSLFPSTARFPPRRSRSKRLNTAANFTATLEKASRLPARSTRRANPPRRSHLHFVFQWDFSANISDSPVKTTSLAAKEAPLAGKWSLSLHGESGGAPAFRVCHTGVAPAVFDKAVTLKSELLWVDPHDRRHFVAQWRTGPKSYPSRDAWDVDELWEVRVDLELLQKTAANSKGRYSPESHRAYSFVFTLEQDYPKPPPHASSRAAARMRAQRISTLNLGQLPHDRQIDVTQSARSTYHALLVHFQTGFIRFCPLSSTFLEPASRRNYLVSKYEENPSLPLPVSPKSVFRLAHLDLADLKTSPYAIRSSLSVSNAATELFDDISIEHDEMRQVVLEFVKDNWDDVRDSNGWKEKMKQIEADEVLGGAPIMVKLLSWATMA
ncbi:hypothetical protein JCM8547_002326 [Rhodosporidiobolus lusitaniae]